MKIKFTTILFGIALIALSRVAQAVVPPPDGGYPGGNTAEGQSALFSLTTGSYNTANGWNSLHTLSNGSFNTGIGAATLFSNTADQNTATGAAALFSNTTGALNTANGAFALLNNTTGSYNTALGTNALFQNTEGIGNTAVGLAALKDNATGSRNTAAGFQALFQNTAGSDNTADGSQALYSNTTGPNNTAIGAAALNRNTTGATNTAIGWGVLLNNDGNDNTGVGVAALISNATGSGNTAVGRGTLELNISGGSNTGCGIGALRSNVAGTGNTAVGYQSLYNMTDGSYNIAVAGGGNLTSGNFNIVIGNDGAGNESGVIRIGSGCCQSQTFIAAVYGTIISGGTGVYVNSDGQLGIPTSSIRFKDEVRPMDKVSEAILALRPVSFRYKKQFDPQCIPQFGLVAEEVEKVDPELVIHDQEGKPYTVRYEQINAMLLNEFLKEHRKVEELESRLAKQQATIGQQQKDLHSIISQQRSQFETFTAKLNEQAAQIREVSAEIETNRAVSDVVLGDR